LYTVRGTEYSQAPATPISNILSFSSLPFISFTEIHTILVLSYLHEILLIFPEMMYVLYSYTRKVGHHADISRMKRIRDKSRIGLELGHLFLIDTTRNKPIHRISILSYGREAASYTLG